MTWLSIWGWGVDLGWLLLLLLTLRHFWRDRQLLVGAQSWLKTQGRINHCEWVTVRHRIWPKINYTYQVHEQELVGDHLFLDTVHNSPNSRYARRIAYKAVTAFKDKTEIDVYYNPNHPEQSALDVTIPKKLNIILILISLLLLIQSGVLIRALY